MTNNPSGQPAPVSRRRVLGLAGVAALGLGATVVGCGNDSGSPARTASNGASAGGDLGTLTYAFSWVNDVTQAGPYIADTKGYYLKQGFSTVEFVTGGSNAVPVLTQLLNGKANFGVSDVATVAAANAQGASFRIIGAMYQKTPLCIVSLGKSVIAHPRELSGKTIGIADGDKPAAMAFLKSNELSKDDLTIVPYAYDPTPLINGQIDGYVGYTTQDPITLAEAGHTPSVLAFSEFGYQTVTQTYVATTDAISKSADVLTAALTADVMGWRDNIASPEEGARLTVQKYGKSLGYTLDNQLGADRAGVELIVTPDTRSNGILTVTDQLQAQTVTTLSLSGIPTTVSDLFDLTLLTAVYTKHPELIGL